jgi:hypothetical protein
MELMDFVKVTSDSCCSLACFHSESSQSPGIAHVANLKQSSFMAW